MDENFRFVAAYLHLLETVKIFDGIQTDIAETLLDLMKWIRSEYNITDEDISSFKSTVEEISGDGKIP